MIQFLLRSYADKKQGILTLRVCNRFTDFRISCGYSLPVKDWIADAQCLRGFTDTCPRPYLDMLSYADLTQRMFELKKNLEQIDEDDLTRDLVRENMMAVLHDVKKKKEKKQENTKPTFLEFIQQYADECKDGTRKCFRTSDNIGAETIKSYIVLLHKLQDFQKRHHTVIDWDDITISWVRLWKKDLAEQYKPNYIAHLISILKRMLNAGREMHYTTCMDYTMKEFSGHWEAVDNVYLTHDMLNQLWDANLTDIATITERIKQIKDKDDQTKAALILVNNSLESLQQAKDIFMVGCMTGQRISDYKRINSGFIVKLRDGREYISIEQKKTKKQVFIPVDPRVSEILAKYNGSLPVLSDVHMNAKLKDIGLLMGWTHLTVIKNSKTGAFKKFYECMVTHTARRTFATLAYEDGVPASAIMAITGHSSEDTFRKYIKTSAKDRAILAAQEFFNVRELGHG